MKEPTISKQKKNNQYSPVHNCRIRIWQRSPQQRPVHLARGLRTDWWRSALIAVVAQVPTLPTEHRSTSLVTRTTNPLERSSRRLPNGRDSIFQNIVTRNFSTRSTRDSRPKRIFKRRRHGTTGKTRNRRLIFPWKPAGIANLHLISVYHRKRYDASERHEGGGVKRE